MSQEQDPGASALSAIAQTWATRFVAAVPLMAAAPNAEAEAPNAEVEAPNPEVEEGEVPETEEARIAAAGRIAANERTRRQARIEHERESLIRERDGYRAQLALHDAEQIQAAWMRNRPSAHRAPPQPDHMGRVGDFYFNSNEMSFERMGVVDFAANIRRNQRRIGRGVAPLELRRVLVFPNTVSWNGIVFEDLALESFADKVCVVCRDPPRNIEELIELLAHGEKALDPIKITTACCGENFICSETCSLRWFQGETGCLQCYDIVDSIRSDQATEAMRVRDRIVTVAQSAPSRPMYRGPPGWHPLRHVLAVDDDDDDDEDDDDDDEDDDDDDDEEDDGMDPFLRAVLLEAVQEELHVAHPTVTRGGGTLRGRGGMYLEPWARRGRGRGRPPGW